MVATESFRLPGCIPENVSSCTLEATVTTGFEEVAVDECNTKFQNHVLCTRGRIAFDLPIEEVPQALTLKCIDNIGVIIGEVDDMEFGKSKDECLEKIKNIMTNLDWRKGIQAWQTVTLGCILTSDDILNFKREENKETKFSFRVTCTRIGNKHAFKSPDASSAFGGIINDHFGWKVDLTNFDLEVLLNICDNYLYVELSLTRESLHRRNMEVFGPTTLRPTISHCMLRLASIKPEEFVCDPLCGSGSIVVEGLTSWPDAFYFCGDKHERAKQKTLTNVSAINAKLVRDKKKSVAVEIFQWDATNLPFKDEQFDVIVTNLPFGIKIGNKKVNDSLYPRLFRELGRVTKRTTGRAIVLTTARSHISRVLKHTPHLWKLSRRLDVNIGGLNGCVFIMKRNGVNFKPELQKNKPICS